jgi:prevent-host-death family protein
MASYNVHEAKSNLSKLLKQTAEGERVIIMRGGEPVAELVPYRSPRKKVQLGFAAGQVRMKKGWEKPLSDSEVVALFIGKP